MNLRPLNLILGMNLLAVIAAGAAMTHEATGLIGDTRQTRSEVLSSFCLDPNENILACDAKAKCVRVISRKDKLLAKWTLAFEPQVIACRSNGTVIVAGAGQVALLDPKGKIVASTNLPALPMPMIPDSIRRDMDKAEIERRINSMRAVTGAATMGEDIFICAKGNTGLTVYRMDSRLGGLTNIIKGLSGCCGQMDITAQGNTLYVANNGRSQIEMYDRDGKPTGAFGKNKEKPDSYFNGCCEPKNVCIGPDGSIYAAESAQCCVNRFSPDGTLLDRIGRVKRIAGCVRVTVALTRDTNRVYMLDTEHNTIHVLDRTDARR